MGISAKGLVPPGVRSVGRDVQFRRDALERSDAVLKQVDESLTEAAVIAAVVSTLFFISFHFAPPWVSFSTRHRNRVLKKS